MKAFRHQLVTFIWVMYAVAAMAQVNGGQHVFTSLQLPASARITALGGMHIAVRDEDPAFAVANPATLNSLMSGRLNFQHNFFLSDVQQGMVQYAHEVKRLGFTAHGGLQYLNYGDIKRSDEFGTIIGDIKAREQHFFVGAARPLSEKVSLGLNLRFASARLDDYRSTAMLADAGLLYADTSRRLTAAVVVRNAGTQLSTFAGTREDLPFDIQVSVTKRLRYLPFRFGIVAHHLHRRNIRFDDPNFEAEEVLLFGEEQPAENKLNQQIDNFFRHLIFNGEFLLGRNEVMRLRFAYNHLRKRELSVQNYRSLAGFSGGVGIKISRFRIDLGYGSYHLAGGVLHLGVGTNLREFF